MKRISTTAVCSVLLALMLALMPAAVLAETTVPAASASEYFSRRDLAGSWDEDEAIRIQLNGDSAACETGAAEINGSTVTITREGVYVLTGTLEQGNVIIDADDSAKVQLVLDQASVHAVGTAAITVENADKVFITLADDSDNALSASGSFSEDSNVDAAVFARDDLVFNGTGRLTVTCENGNGIVGKDDLK